MKKIREGRYIRWRDFQNCGNGQNEAYTLFLNILFTTLKSSNFDESSGEKRTKLVGLLLNLFIYQFIQIKPTRYSFRDIVAQTDLSELRANIVSYESHVLRSRYAFGSICEVFWNTNRDLENDSNPVRTLYWRWIDRCHPSIKQPIEPFILELAKEAGFYPGSIYPSLTFDEVNKKGFSFSKLKKAAEVHVTATLMEEVIREVNKLSSAPGSYTLEIAQQRDRE